MPTKTCPECGAQFTCGSDSPEPCWCASLPQIVEMTPGRDCLCPACLTREIENRVQLHQLECERVTPIEALKSRWQWLPVPDRPGQFTLESSNDRLAPANLWGGLPPAVVDVYSTPQGQLQLTRYPEGALVSLLSADGRQRHLLCEPDALDQCLREFGVERDGERGA